ncbi:hypothetical protein [Bizionia arctica]|uniref:Carboxypeptidase-like regulatory domain-containing protein n=1 Tax=Bizionia arctica TaxID=1495645 RepID=A0A917LLP2_9FLAO|nr:hypothetical protein [Bizionia arctica]GGG41381.1 hypothetical protein GCM10010976_11250 [Bizionia arctica]
MRNILPLIVFFMSFSIAVAQNSDRIEISGKVIVDSNDVEGLTVNNLTSNRIAVTDLNGNFNIYVALNDQIKISALQLDTILIIVTQDILDSKQITVFLDERLTTLDEVVILPFSLTGDLETDLTNVRTFNPEFESMYFGDFDWEDAPNAEIYYQKVENTIMNRGKFYNGVDFVKLTNWLVKPMFASNTSRVDKNTENSNFDTLRNTYTTDFISTNFNIPEDQVIDFIAFAEVNNADPSLYDNGKEIELIEYLVSQSHLFLDTKSKKN